MRSHLSVLLAFLFSYAWGQTGPGGVGNASSNVLWLSADNGVYSNAGTTPAVTTDNVQQWNDRSGNGNDATHATLAERPNYQTNVVNGFPVIRFSAANADRLLATGIASGNAASVWAVAAWSSTPSTNPGLIHGAPAGQAFSTGATDKVIGMWVSNGAAHNVWGRGVQSNNTSIDIPQVTGTLTNTFYSFLNRYDGASNISQYVNNAAAGSVAYNGTLKSWTDFGIGRQGNETWNGDIAEVIAYNVAVNSAQRIIINNYLAAKYNLTLSVNDVYTGDNSGYDYEVAGIGRVDGANIHSDAQGSGMVRILNPSNLGNNEFFMWGHDNGSLTVVNTTDIPGGVQGRLSRVWSVSEPTNVGNLDIRFDLTGQGPVTASDLRLLVDADGDGSFSDGGTLAISGATALGANVYLFSAVPGASIANGDRFTIGTANIVQTPLPIVIESFSGEMIHGNASLHWATLTELNNHFFTVERSENGKDFRAVGNVKGWGTSIVRRRYQYTDVFPPSGKLYYRLKQTDFDEQTTNSEVIMLENKFEGIALTAVPNPSKGGGDVSLRINHPEHIESKNVAVEIHDLYGRRISISRLHDKDNEIRIRFPSREASGIYIVSARSRQLSAPLFTRIQLIK